MSKDYILEKIFCTMLSSYRWVPLLGMLLLYKERVFDDKHYKVILNELCDYICQETSFTIRRPELIDTILDFVVINRSWIEYCLADMYFYSNMYFDVKKGKKDIDTIREDMYLYRMDCQARTVLWESGAFEFKNIGKELSIIDLGAGSIPYFSLIREVNNDKITKYLCIDKRDISIWYMRKFPCVPFTFEYEQTDVIDYKNKDATILFAAEFLHCLKDPISFLQGIPGNFKNVVKLAFIEIDPDRQIGLGQAFSFHMLAHNDTLSLPAQFFADVKIDTFKYEGYREASAYHNLYSFIRT